MIPLGVSQDAEHNTFLSAYPPVFAELALRVFLALGVSQHELAYTMCPDDPDIEKGIARDKGTQ